MHQYAKAKKAFLKSHTLCFKCGAFIVPENRDLHHYRGRAGTLYLDERFWRMVCRDCHSWIHNHPRYAIITKLMAGPGEWNIPVPPDHPFEGDKGKESVRRVFGSDEPMF